MRKKFRRRLRTLLSAVMTAALLAGTAALPSVTAEAAEESVQQALYTATDLNAYIYKNNISNNNYSILYYGSVVDSYLVENTDGTLTRVENTEMSDQALILLETYTQDGSTLLNTASLPAELSLFGGFYSGADYNYVVFGQSNSDESDSAEILRVVQYSKSWERLGSASVYGANTTIPFKSGSLRMTEAGGNLYIHTSHQMYTSSDGKNHQANMTYVVSQSSMEVTGSMTGVVWYDYGYVSHSFNQFIQTDGTFVYRVDQGDAYPSRGIVLSRMSAGSSVSRGTYQTIYSFQGTTGANATGVSIGGFELSDTYCLVAGNSVDQSSADTYNTQGQRNIFLTATTRDLGSTRVTWLTDYTEGSGIEVRNPQMVKLDTNLFLVMWEEAVFTLLPYTYDGVSDYYWGDLITTSMVLVDGAGSPVTDVVQTDMRLSDCQPVLTSDGAVTWYVTDDSFDRNVQDNVYTATLYKLYPGVLLEMAQ